MKLLITIVLLWQLWYSTVYANASNLGSVPIDTRALDNKRLFFSENQRQVGGVGDIKNELTTQSTVSDGANTSGADARRLDFKSEKLLHYTGIVSSARGVQLLLNGYPWRPGQLAVIRARLQPDTHFIEIETTGGEIHRLLPGDTVEVTP